MSGEADDSALAERIAELEAEVRRLRGGVAAVEMVEIPGDRISDELCPFCRVVSWRLGRVEDRAKHRPGCLWVRVMREVSDG